MCADVRVCAQVPNFSLVQERVRLYAILTTSALTVVREESVQACYKLLSCRYGSKSCTGARCKSVSHFVLFSFYGAAVFTSSFA